VVCDYRFQGKNEVSVCDELVTAGAKKEYRQ
jgi:hypothetical protein